MSDQNESPIKLDEQTLALLEVLTLTNKTIEEGKVRSVEEAFRRIRGRIKG